jgi:hypothetical protein
MDSLISREGSSKRSTGGSSLLGFSGSFARERTSKEPHPEPIKLDVEEEREYEDENSDGEGKNIDNELTFYAKTAAFVKNPRDDSDSEVNHPKIL